jgi:dTDP-4-dehydrorhamnose reductase
MHPTFHEAIAQLVTALTHAYRAPDELGVYHAVGEAEAGWKAAMQHITDRAGLTPAHATTHEGADDDHAEPRARALAAD